MEKTLCKKEFIILLTQQKFVLKVINIDTTTSLVSPLNFKNMGWFYIGNH